MNVDRWKRVDELLQSALLVPSAERDEFLRRACAGDDQLELEVRSLLASHHNAGSFLENPALQIAARAIAMAEVPPGGSDAVLGQTISHYRVLEKLGSGGMGAVYEAEDTRLGRHVALKLLLDSQSANRKALQRFEQEARAISSLNHPNICTLYDIEEYNSKPVIVMELLTGQTLEAQLKRGRVALHNLVNWGIDIADGLDAAHTAGIIHRDIKPTNIFIANRGQAKILDFGLAKLTSPSPGESRQEHDHLLTSVGVIPGTTAYMSPEQVRGEDLDNRTDLFSLGTVLYEMATGQRPFGGKNVALTMDAVLNRQPTPISELNPDPPPVMQEIIERALQKERNDRYQSAAEFGSELKLLKRAIEIGLTPRLSSSSRIRRQVAKSKRKMWLAAMAAFLCIAVIGMTIYLRRTRAPKLQVLTDQDTIVLSDFTNTTGDAVFDETLKQGLFVQLQQSPFLQIISDRKVNDTLKLMGRSPGDRLTESVTRDVCLRTGSKAMLNGSIASLGSHYVLGLTALNCNTGDVLAEAQEQANGKEEVLNALGAASTIMRKRLGESLSSVEKFATTLSAATTPSLEALRQYSLGQKTRYTQGETPAIAFLKRAIEIDPNFAVAYATLSSIYFNLSEGARAAAYGQKAYDLRDKVSDIERLGIETNYYTNVTGDLDRAAQVLDLWYQNYPKRFDLCMDTMNISLTMGEREKALRQCLKSSEKGPSAHYIHYVNLAIAYTSLNRFDDAENTFREAAGYGLNTEFLRYYRYKTAFLRGDTAEMAQLVSSAHDQTGQNLMLQVQADTETWYGRLQAARELVAKAVASAKENDSAETAGSYLASLALNEMEFGRSDLARADARSALKLTRNRDVLSITSMVLSRTGDPGEGEKLSAELNKAFPLDTVVQQYWLPCIRGMLALRHRDPNRALGFLGLRDSIEMGIPSQLQIALCPSYLRGQAYLMLRDGAHAATEFQKFIDHRGLVGNFSWGVLAHLGLARGYAMQADTIKAHTAYQDFVTLWKNADADIPIMKQAKSEYEKLD